MVAHNSATFRLHYDQRERATEEQQMAEPEAKEDAVEREIDVPATREETWRALTDAEFLREWLADDAELDLRPGGDLALRTADGEREGFFEEISEPSRLVFWWGEPGGDLSRVEIELSELEDGTRVRVIESQPVVTVDAFGIGIESESGGATPQMSALAIVG
jgi:uncharacterized protein YndB with AHSA1/START domain